MNLAVVGCGPWGQNIIRTLDEIEDTENFKLNEVIHNGNSERADWVTKKTGLDTHTDYQGALARNSAVCIATPDETHPRFVRAALESNVHAFVEKPLAFDGDEARRLYDLAKTNNCTLTVGHLMIYHPLMDKLGQKSERSAEFEEIQVTRFNNHRSSGNRRLLHSSLIHDLTVLDELFETPPNSIDVHEALGPFPPGRYISATLEYGGLPVRIRARADWPFEKREMTFRTEEEFYRFNGLDDTLEIKRPNGDENNNEKIRFETLPLTEELRNFVLAAQGKDDCNVTEDHVMRVMETMDRLEERAQQTTR